MYDALVKPIEHLGAKDTVSAAELRNCLGKVAEVIEGHFSPPMESADVPADSEPETITGADEADIE